MLTCIARSKQPSDDSRDHQPEKFNSNSAPANKQAVKTLTSQVHFSSIHHFMINSGAKNLYEKIQKITKMYLQSLIYR